MNTRLLLQTPISLLGVIIGLFSKSSYGFYLIVVSCLFLFVNVIYQVKSYNASKKKGGRN